LSQALLLLDFIGQIELREMFQVKSTMNLENPTDEVAFISTICDQGKDSLFIPDRVWIGITLENLYILTFDPV
jgi:hypothetical protein